MSEVVHSVNIMIAILLVGVCVTIYWIFKYDDWNPNPITVHNDSSESTHGSFIPDGGVDTEDPRV